MITLRETLSKALVFPAGLFICSKHADLGVGRLFVSERGWVTQGTLWHHDAFALCAVHVL